jgi:hypothetical protein
LKTRLYETQIRQGTLLSADPFYAQIISEIGTSADIAKRMEKLRGTAQGEGRNVAGGTAGKRLNKGWSTP